MALIRSVAFFAYPVADMARARAFYEGLLGLTLGHDFEGRWVEYDIAGVTFALTTMAEELAPGARGGFVALEVDNLDEVVATLKFWSVPFLVEIFETPVCRMAVIADPDGNGITLHQRLGPIDN